MPDALLQKQVKARRVTTLNHIAAEGLSDPVRMRILQLVNQKPMNTDEIVKALGNSGVKKATTTVRHHIDALKNAGLVEVARMVEVRGAVMKYYSGTLRVFDCQPPADLDNTASKIIDDTSNKLTKILKSISEDKRFNALCKDGKCREFLAIEIINAALVKAMDRSEFQHTTPAQKKNG